ncbi:MAG: TlpA family protein disulfide reductase, partial [Bacteroidales bacterium]|nr:TlpA family protein disulfide reductase [Bacteroidales bacterium]
MKRISIFFSLLLIISGSSCNSGKNGNREIVMIFHNAPAASFYHTPFGGTLMPASDESAHLVAYVENGREKFYAPGIGTDTLRININNSSRNGHRGNFKEVLLNYKNIETYYTLLKVGDTIDIFYDKYEYPQLKSRTNDMLTQYYNFCTSIKDRKSYWGIEALSGLTSLRRMLEKLENTPDKYTPREILKIKEKEYVPVDSLKQAFKEYIKNYEQQLTEYSGNSADSKTESEYFEYVLNLKRQISDITDAEYDNAPLDTNIILNFIKNERLDYISYVNFIKWEFTTVLLKNKYNIPLIKETNGGYWDWKIFFRKAEVDSSLTKNIRNIVLLRSIMGIKDLPCSNDTIKEYVDKYISITGDTAYVNSLKIKYKIAQAPADKLLLEDKNSGEITLDSVLVRHKDKVIYVDFCASWCAPCMGAMKYAKKLRQNYKGKNVAFIYLSLDKNNGSWKNAVQAFDIGTMSECYRIINLDSSDFIRTINVQLIPRYIIYDSKGNFCYTNAPGPKGKEIRS